MEKDKPVLVAVSGGADSVSLLDVLLRAGYACVAAHCNFALRGAESDRDETFVRDLCAQWKVALEVIRFDTRSYARTHSVSIEVAARELRYTWFDQVAKQHRCQAVAVAHHQNDQAETIYSVPIVRPLLCTTRDYIEHYLRDKRHLTWVTDSTNSDTSITRNAVREQLRTYTKAEIEHMAQTAEYVQGYVDMIENKNTREAGIVKLHEELRAYNFTEIDKIYDALQKGEGGKVFTSKTHQAVIRKGKLCVTTVS